MDHGAAHLEPITFAAVRAEDLRGAVAPQLVARVMQADDAVAVTDGDAVVGVAASVRAEGHRDLVAWWVDPDARGKGVGGALLRWVLGQAAPGVVRVAAPNDDAAATVLDAYGFELDADGMWRSPFGVIRQAVRAVVTDSTHRVALVRFDIGGVRFWNLPGGGIEPGETTREALVRELHEELGFALSQAAVGPLAWHYLHWWRDYHREMARPDGQLERVHVVEAPITDLEPAIGWDGLAAEWVIDMRWWGLDELASTTERFATAELPGRIMGAVAASSEAPERKGGSGRAAHHGAFGVEDSR